MWKVYLKLALIVLTTASTVIPTWIATKTRRLQTSYAITQFTYKTIARIIGLKVIVRGTPSDSRPLLLASNHISYLDIVSYGVALPIIFTPKSDIANWPVIGPLCKLVGCVFIERKATKTAENMKKMQDALSGARPVLLFAEGTTSDSKRILPIRSSYFSITKAGSENSPIMVQPALIAYTKINNLPIDSTTRPLVAWYGDMELMPHLKRLLLLNTVQAEIEFFPALNPQEFENRKELSSHLETMLTTAHQNLL